MNALELLGKKKEGSLSQTLFYFIREFKLNPFDEEYEATVSYKGDKIDKINITKKGISILLFGELIREMQEHYKREEKEMKKARRR